MADPVPVFDDDRKLMVYQALKLRYGETDPLPANLIVDLIDLFDTPPEIE